MTIPVAALFDLDGTLADTDPLWNRAEEALLAQTGLAWDRRLSEKLIGTSMVEGARIIKQATGLEWSVEEINRHLVSAMVAQLRQHIPWNEGVLELLGAMRARGVQCYIVTSSYREMAEILLMDLPPGTFAGIVAGDEVTNTKPHPEPYLTACRMAGAEPRRCLAIEDSPTGAQSALAAGAVTVAIQGRLRVSSTAGLSRVSSATELTPAVISRLMQGEVIDVL